MAAATPPIITSVSPDPIDAGGQSFLLVVSGSGFVDGAAITWLPQTPSATPLGKMTFVSSTQLSAEVTTALRTTEGAYNVNVTNPGVGGAVSNVYPLTISPVILTITPLSVPAGSPAVTITAKGIGFTQKIQLVLNASGQRTVLPAIFVDTKTLTAVVPASALTAAGSISIQAFDPVDNIASATSVQFVIRTAPVIPATPVITAASLSVFDAGGAGFYLAVNGTGFTPTSVVNWSGSALGTTFASSTQLQALITSDLRSLSGTFNLTVSDPIGGTSNPYAVTVSPVLFTINPAATAAGGPAVTVTATGVGFTRNSVLALVVAGQQSQLTTAYVNSTALNAVIPASALRAAGSAVVQVVDSGGPGHSLTHPFTISALVPTLVPTLTFASPSPMDAGGPPFVMSVSGAGFVAGSAVNWSGAALGTTFVSSTQLQAVITTEIRSLSGTFNLTVSDPTGATSNPYAITVSPVLFTIGPSVAAAGGPAVTITATGIGFTRNSVLAITAGGQLSPLATTFVKSTILIAIVPTTALHFAGAASVQVVDSAGPGRSLTQQFTISEPIPTVLGIGPTAATAGAPAFTLTVNGANFVAGGTVLWNGLPLVTAFLNTAQLTALVPAALVQSVGIAAIAASNPGGTVSNSLTFTVNPSAPVIISLSPNTAAAGGPAVSLTVNGANFVAGSTVQWNGAPLATAFVSTAKLVANVPASLFIDVMSAAVSVGNPGSAVSGSLAFSVDPPHPIIGSLSPASATAGGASFILTVTGSGFAVNCVLRWNGTPLDTTFVSGTQVSAIVTAGVIAAGGALNVTLINPSGLTSNAATFAVNTPVPIISDISPASAPAGGPAFTLTINGVNFLRTSTVLWNGVPLATALVSGAQLTAAVPAALPATSGTATVKVSTPGATDSNVATFTIGPAALIVASPATTSAGIVNAASGLPSIAPGSLISIYGTNLAPGNASAPGVPLPASLNGTAVTVNGSPAPLIFVSPLQINAQVPFETKAGTATLTVQSGSLKSPAVTFHIIETAPGVLTVPPGNHAIARNDSDGALNSPDSPAQPGQYVTVYLTGQGQVDNPVATGAAGPATPFSVPLAPIQAQIGGSPAFIAFAGLAPGFVGLLQMNIVIPDVASGEQPFDVTIGGVVANRTLLSVKADR